MENDIIISVKGVSKVFKILHDRQHGLKGTILNIVKRENGYEKFHALKDINFDIKKGEFIGIIGRNGSGKSTLLKIIAGILKPTKGTIEVDGKIVPFLELGLGFQGELTGKDNVYLYGAVLGLTKKQIDKKYKEIIKFAELERFMDTKLKNYSSGMHARLSFSIAIQSDAEILLIDEVLAVGDLNFQQKCMNIFENFKKSGKTIIFVSHDLETIKKMCDRCLLIDNGLLKINDTATKAIEQYLSLLNCN